MSRLTIQEAIELIKQVPLYRYECELEKHRQSDLFQALNLSIEAMQELQHYKDLEEQGRLKVQVHGQWEIFTDEYDCEYMLCTACGGEFYPVDEDTVGMTYNYCPNCGAKMKGSKW